MRALPFAMMALTACTSGSADIGTIMPGSDIQLEDVNPTSSSFGELVALGDVGDAATAWYFTHST